MRDEDSPTPVVHLVSHTHWDREWYHPAARFRQRLTTLVDELLHDPPEPPTSFLLDGQAIILDDYLDVRPENREAIARLLQDGALEAGPWYVLADELIPSGESLIRNLLAGRRILASLGATSPPVLYCPDSFGHPAALPTLAAGFGLPMVILWRGYGSRRWPPGDSAWWMASDGSRTLLFHLPRDGYEFGANLPVSHEHMARRWNAMRAELESRSRLGLLLVTNGADHHARQQDLGKAVDALREVARPIRVLQGSLRAFAEDATARSATAALPEISGELRDSYGYTWTLAGTLGSRSEFKQRAAFVERLLLRDVEPWIALVLARHHNSAGPAPGSTVSGFHAHLQEAWRTLLRTHPHDTLCGCVTDEVARAASARLESACTQAEGLRTDAINAIVRHDEASARTRSPMWRSVLVIRNAAARARGGVAEVELLAKISDVPVGPGSARPDRRRRPRTHAHVRLADAGIPVQVLEREQRYDLTESPRHYPDCDLVDYRQALVWIPPIDAYGTRSWDVVSEWVSTAGKSKAEEPACEPVVADGLSLSNGILTVSADPRGRVTLKAGGRIITDLLALEHQADLGDLYTPSLRGKPVANAVLRRQSLTHSGPLRATIEQRWTLRVPLAAGARRPVEIPFQLCLSLDAAAEFVRVRISGNNTAHDHRLRLLFRTGTGHSRVVADAAFGPALRKSLEVPDDDAAMERPVPTAPLHRWVASFDDDAGITLFSDGLAEYEAVTGGAIAVTLLRGVGELARADLPERPGRAGWPAKTPEAQAPGPFSADFAVYPCGPLADDTLAEIERIADEVLHPLRGSTLRSALRLPAPTSGLELSGRGLVLSALKPSDDGEWTVVRLVNVTAGEVRGRCRTGFEFTEVCVARLDETPGEALSAAANSFEFVAPPHAVLTFMLR